MVEVVELVVEMVEVVEVVEVVEWRGTSFIPDRSPDTGGSLGLELFHPGGWSYSNWCQSGPEMGQLQSGLVRVRRYLVAGGHPGDTQAQALATLDCQVTDNHSDNHTGAEVSSKIHQY